MVSDISTEVKNSGDSILYFLRLPIPKTLPVNFQSIAEGGIRVRVISMLLYLAPS